MSPAGERLARVAPHARPNPRIPAFARAVLEGLRIQDPDLNGLRALDDEAWRDVLAFCDPAQLTLLLGRLCGDAMPAWVRERIEADIVRYERRFRRLKGYQDEIAAELDRRGIPFVLLKGVAHSPDFTPDPALRAQGDIDIWSPGERAYEARDALLEAGYRTIGESRGRHLDPLVRDTGWQWTGDYFASDLPIGVEIHFELWDSAAEFIEAAGEDEFWERRTGMDFEGRRIPVLSRPDALAFSALHLLMHILHGDVRLQRAWEIANFLDRASGDSAFWQSWQSAHGPMLRRLQAIVFSLVAEWFGARLAPTVEAEIEALPADVRLWLDCYSPAPVENLFTPNKSEIWLHAALLESAALKWKVFLRRAFPPRLPASAATEGGGAEHLHRLRQLGSRAWRHLRALAPTALDGVRWQWLRSGLGGEFLRLQAGSAPFNFGVVVFLVLHNLYLLGSGFHVNTLGRIASAMTLGTFAGSLPAAAIMRRIGIRGAILAAIGGVALTEFARVWFLSEPLQIAFAFANGWFLAAWGVSYSPAIAALSRPRTRQLAFSVACFTGIVTCAVAGLAGGALPGIIQRALHIATTVRAERAALLFAPGIVAMAALPMIHLSFPPPSPAPKGSGFSGRFLLPFLIVLAIWSGALGAFNPFFNAFFSVRLGFSAGAIGGVYASSQVAQAVCLLLTPAIFRRLGTLRGIAVLECGVAVSMLSLAFGPPAFLAGAAYVALNAFHYMSEPAVLNTLMSRAAEEHRGRVSAMYLAATGIAGSVAALAGGAGISRFGYAPVLAASAVVSLAGVAVFRFLVSAEAGA